MSSLSQVSSPETFPWRVNGKLQMRFVNSSGNDEYYVCSATLVDAKTILTAGHCIFNRNSNIMDWPAEVWFWPAYENGAKPYTTGKGTWYASWTGWTSSGDYAYDQAYVRLSKPIGGITGWFGYGYNNNCSFFTTPTHHNASYPAESAYGWDGQYMYYRFGDFDSCPSTNRIQYNSAGYGGMSGSSSYWIDGSSNRFAYSVASTSDRLTYTRHTDMWSGAFTYLRDTVIAGQVPSTYDLWAMWCTGTPTTVTAGQSLTDMDFNVTNYSSASTGNGPWNFDVRISTNDIISTFDILEGNYNFNWTFGANGSVNVNMGSSVQIPYNLASGTYYVGVILNNSDNDTSNNDSSGDDALQITVNGVADPEAQSVAAPSGTHYHGENINVSYDVENIGGDPASSVTIEIRASLNTTITTFDTLLGSFSYGTLNGGSTINDTKSVTIPDTLAQNDYYIGIIVNSSNDNSSSNNTAYDATPLTVDGRSDLVAVAVNAANGSYFPCDDIPVAFSVMNDGTIGSGNYTVDVRASTNTVISTFDTQIGLFNYTDLASGSTRNSNQTVQFPAGMNPDDYYIGIIVSAGTNEIDNSDNTNFDATTIAAESCSADYNGDCTVNSQDFVAFLNDFVAGNADYNGDTTTNSTDFIAFLNDFVAGC
jgi:V8-like Glu-specific endopeptidase